MRTVLAAIALVLASSVLADDGARLAGTWNLVSVAYEDVATRARTPVLGEHPKGTMVVTSAGRWITVVTAEGRKVPQTDEERAAALRSMIAYAGRYRVEGDKVVTKVEVAWNEAWVGTDQTRFFRFDGDRLHIESAPQPHPNVGGKVVRVIVTWEREK
jgi:hypothetical protein